MCSHCRVCLLVSFILTSVKCWSWALRPPLAPECARHSLNEQKGKRILHKCRPNDEGTPRKKQERTAAVRMDFVVLQSTGRCIYPDLLNDCVCHKRHVNSHMWAGILFLRYLKSKYNNTFKFTVFPLLHAGKHLHVEFLIILVKEKI